MLNKSIAPLATYISFWLFVVVVFTQKLTAPSIIALYIPVPYFQSQWFTLRQINTQTLTHTDTGIANFYISILCFVLVCVALAHNLFAMPNNKSPLNWNMGINWRSRTIHKYICHTNYHSAKKLRRNGGDGRAKCDEKKRVKMECGKYDEIKWLWRDIRVVYVKCSIHLSKYTHIYILTSRTPHNF